MGIFDINWKGIVQETLMITSFVIIMMLLIEFVNVLTSGKLSKKLSKNIYVQVITGTLLGLIPGCMGTFTAVSLYTHRMLSFGALVATMIATSGDEAYFMLAWIPKEALMIFAASSLLAVITGIIVDRVFKNKSFVEKHDFSFDIHEKHCNDKETRLFAFENISFLPARMVLVTIVTGVLVLTFTGWIGHSHSDKLMFSLPEKETGKMVQISNLGSSSQTEHAHIHTEDCEHTEHNHHNLDTEHQHEHSIDWIKITIIVSAIFALIIILFTSEHFVKQHLINHVLKKHLLKIFLWIAATLIAINLILHNFDVGTWIYDNMFFILIIALLLGVIPQSGPHLVFVVMFIQGLIPFSILLASSIVQDGHGALPLLAESKKSFLVMKFINILVGLLVGSLGLLLNF